MLTKLFLQIVSTVVAFLPTIIFFIVKAVVAPNGFWQSIVVYGLGFYVLGGIQFVLFIVWVGVSLTIWTD